MDPGSPQQFKPVRLRLGQGLLMAVDNLRRIVLHPPQGDESSPLKGRTRRSLESLRVGIDRGCLILPQNAFAAPLLAVGRRPRIYVLQRIVGCLGASQDDLDEVVGAGSVIPFLHGRANLVIGLGYHLRGGNPLEVVTKSAKWKYVSHRKPLIVTS